jgi:uncharacterized protein (TIGR03083 family)
VDHAAALFEQTRSFGELVRAADFAAPVPTCPGWSIQQLFRHVGRGDRWAAQIVRDRLDDYVDPRTVAGGKPPDDLDGAIQWLHDGSRALVDAVAEAGADTPVWTFLGTRPAAWWVRRRLHEVAVHRADAALALGAPYDLPAPLAADAVSEWLDRVVAERGILAARGVERPTPLASGVTLHLHATEPDLGPAGEWLLRGTDDGLSWEPGHTKATAAARGRAVDLLLALLRRRPAAEADVEILGDDSVWAQWLERTPL